MGKGWKCRCLWQREQTTIPNYDSRNTNLKHQHNHPHYSNSPLPTPTFSFSQNPLSNCSFPSFSPLLTTFHFAFVISVFLPSPPFLCNFHFSFLQRCLTFITRLLVLKTNNVESLSYVSLYLRHFYPPLTFPFIFI
jgi:hypothetical protein